MEIPEVYQMPEKQKVLLQIGLTMLNYRSMLTFLGEVVIMRHLTKRKIVEACMLYDNLKRRLFKTKDMKLKHKILKKLESLESEISQLRQRYYSEISQLSSD